MFKLLTRLICLAVIAVIAFVAISLYSGGEKFRWLGKQVGQQGEKLGEKADRLKETGDKALKGVEKTRDKIKDLTGKGDEKSR